MINNLTYSTGDRTLNPALACPASNTRVQLLEDDVRDRRRRCWHCGRILVVAPVSVREGLTLGFRAAALVPEHRPHT